MQVGDVVIVVQDNQGYRKPGEIGEIIGIRHYGYTIVFPTASHKGGNIITYLLFKEVALAKGYLVSKLLKELYEEG